MSWHMMQWSHRYTGMHSEANIFSYDYATWLSINGGFVFSLLVCFGVLLVCLCHSFLDSTDIFTSILFDWRMSEYVIIYMMCTENYMISTPTNKQVIIISNEIIHYQITVPADGFTPICAWPSDGTLLNKMLHMSTFLWLSGLLLIFRPP